MNNTKQTTLAHDQAIASVMPLFVSEMSRRISELNKAHQSQDLVSLRKVLHQIAGTAGSFGFGAVTIEARSIERSLIKGSSQPDTLDEGLTRLQHAMQAIFSDFNSSGSDFSESNVSESHTSASDSID